MNKRLEWNGKQITNAVKDALAESIPEALEMILDRSNQLVPVDEGTLKNSGNTAFDEETLSGTVYYDTPYAWKVHEDMTANHSNGRRAKYLQLAWQELESKARSHIAEAVKDALGE